MIPRAAEGNGYQVLGWLKESQRRPMTQEEHALVLSRLNRKPDERYGFCQCGCGQKASVAKFSDRSKGWIKGEPKEWCNGHASRCLKPCIEIDSSTGCWNWLKCLAENGYARASTFAGNNTHAAVHRMTWEWVFGAVPDGLDLDHLCRNRKCVNPDHLEPVTRRVNTRRGHGVRLNAELVRTIRSKYEEVRSERRLAVLLGIPRPTINTVLSGRLWGDIV